MRYMFKSLLFVFVLFPVIILFLGALFAVSGNELETIVVVSLLIGPYLGRRLAIKSNLPDSFALRYWPLVFPIVLILTVRICFNAVGAAPSFYEDKVFILLALCYTPLIFLFTVCVPKEKELTSTKWRWQTCAFVVALFVILAWQAKLDSDNTLQNRYSGATIMDEVIVNAYWPWTKSNRLVELDAPASLILSEDFPIIDGATSFVPIYSAVVNEIYQVGDKDNLKNYMTCSRTADAYSRLIRGEVDIIFVFQPSDEHLAEAKNANVELHLTPIAREAFVFFVNNRNPVSDLSIEQIQDIYLKKTTNWQQVGGNNKKILPFQRPKNSGSQTAMLKDVMKDKELPLPLLAEYAGSMGSVYRAVATYRDYEESIGYTFRFYSQVMVQYGRITTEISLPLQNFQKLPIDPDAEPVKLLSINGIAPTAENIRNGSYPFTQDVFVVTAGTENPHVRDLINWLLSQQGQELIEKVGYVGLDKKEI